MPGNRTGERGRDLSKGGVGTATYMGRFEYQSIESVCVWGGDGELVMETEAEGKRWYVRGAGMSSSSLDGLPGSYPSVPLVSWQGGEREAEAQEILVSRRGGY